MYMPEELIHGLNISGGEKIALQSVAVEVVFNNLLCETELIQVYKNLEQIPIEAVYTFPLTSRAVLLGLEVIIDGRKLHGVVVEKSSAEEGYEEAITDGNTAIMLEQVQPGLYTMNAGNILAGEEMQVTVRYAELYTWLGDTLRFHLSTTIAPRYGDPEGAGLQPHQIPEIDVFAENRFQLRMTLAGVLATANVQCPSHQIAVTASQETTVLTLAAGEASMDRDFILNINLPQAAQDAALIDRDSDGGLVVFASFVPQLPVADVTLPRSIKIVVDCSGSMAGDSIAQARQAISDILGQLRPEDYFNIVTFGSSHKACFDRQMKADKTNITKVRRLVRSLEADMGGTEMDQALRAAVQIPGPAILQDVLLITDGELWENDELIDKMKKSNHRVFTIGVGSSVSENFVRRLAGETGGACELVVPNEQMTEKIVRHFKRIFLPRAEGVAVRWPQSPQRTIPKDIEAVYDGDTLHVFAFYSERPEGPVFLDMTLADGRLVSQSIDLEKIAQPIQENMSVSNLARMAMWQALQSENEKDATATALQYQLISRHTNYLVVDKRSDKDKGEGLPKLRKVPQMLAAGWGGTGTLVQESTGNYDGVQYSLRSNQSNIRFSMAPDPEERHRRKQQTTPESFIYSCRRFHTKWFNPVLYIKDFQDLRNYDLPDRIVAAIKTVADQFDPQTSEEIAVLAFLIALLQSPAGSGFDRNTRRAIKKANKRLRPDVQLLNLMRATFACTNKDEWGPEFSLEDCQEDIDNE